MSGGGVVRFAAGFSGWREAARAQLCAGAEPGGLHWLAEDEPQQGLELGGPGGQPGPPGAQPRVARAFFPLAEAVACHASPQRWGLLYRVLWRLTHGEPRLLEVAVDGDVHGLLRMEKAVRRETHRLHAFVRFRPLESAEGPLQVAWFEPQHHVVERATPFFAERFATLRWSLLTPLRCAHWNGAELCFSPGVARPPVEGEDGADALWTAYYAATFNPARVRTAAMRGEMPVRYWRNLPEAASIAGLVRDAPARLRGMLEQAALPAPLAPPPRRRRA